MKHFPAINQHDRMDCGPTCLAMICKFYGRSFSISYLHNLCEISREGVSLYGIYVAAEKVGFRSIGAEIQLKELYEEKFLPCIIYWNQNHFVVLYKIKKTHCETYYYISNPAGGCHLKLTEDEFAKCWISTTDELGNGIGIALLLQPTNNFFSYKENKVDNVPRKTGKLSFLFSYLTPYRKSFFLLFVAMLFGSGIQLMLPFLTQEIVDIGIKQKHINIVLLILMGQLVMEAGLTIIGFFRSWILLQVGTKVNISLISNYLTKLMLLPISFFDAKLTGDIIQRINDHSRIQTFLTDSSLNTLFSLISIVVFGIVIIIYNWIVALIFFFGSITYVCWVWIFMTRRALLDNKMFALNSANQSNVIQLISGMQEIKLNTCEQYKRWEWEHIQRNIYHLSLKGLKLSQYQQSGGMMINQIKNLLITAFCAILVIRGHLTLGMMLSIQYIVGMLNSPIDQLVSFMRQYQDAHLSLDRLLDIYNESNEDSDDNTKPYANEGDIIINQMSFSYDKQLLKPTLCNISLVIPKGKVTAIVGLSGSGKTTLLKMLLGFYHPDSGTIEIKNDNLEEMNKREWRKKCGTVMQEGFIFSDTIARNIAPNVSIPDKHQLDMAAKVANIYDFIEDLPLRYNTRIGNDGHGLSQGQKQRILIARAVYKDPQYLFLDEATNSLDANNEHDIMDHLNQFFKGRTAVIIAHRLSTVRNADQIVVLKDGKIMEKGKHEELVSRKGIYYELVKNQLDI